METTNRMCRWTRRRLPLLAGGELAVEERRRVERHLIGCPGCRDLRDASDRSLDALREFGALGAARPRPEAEPPSLWPALARQIRESRHHPEPTPRWGWRPAGLRLAAAAGLIGVGLGLGVTWVGWSGGRPAPAVAAATPPSPPPVAPVAPAPAPEAIYAINDADLPRAYSMLDRAAPDLDRAATSRAVADASARQPDPFRAPPSLRVDYDLEYVTAPAPSSPALRQAY